MAALFCLKSSAYFGDPNPWGASRPLAALRGHHANERGHTTNDQSNVESHRRCGADRLGALTLPAPAEAGRYYYGHGHGGSGWGAGLLGFGIGAIVGSALAPREVYVEPTMTTSRLITAVPPPTGRRHGRRSGTPTALSATAASTPRTGYFTGYDGLPYFCQ